MGDRQRLKQILLNLLSNAVKYNRQGGRWSWECGPAGDDRMRIQVADTGPGSPPRHGPAVRAFERLGSEQTGVEEAGLGLPLSKRLAEAMGGTWTWHHVGRGEQVLRRAAPARGRWSGPSASRSWRSRPSTTRSPPRDRALHRGQLSNLQLVERMLEPPAGVRLYLRHAPSWAWSWTRAPTRTWILLDLHLPDMPGRRCCGGSRPSPAPPTSRW